MLGKINPDVQQNLFKTRLTELINMEHPLVKLAQEISWDKMETEFANLFSEGGRPSIAIRKIAGMLLLKEMFKESDETVVERWIENAYWQYFTGEDFFQTEQPFDPSNFVHFRKRIGEKGLEFLLGQSVSLHPKAKTEDEVQVGTTVQEKNIMFPTDSKLAKKVIDNCVKIAEKEGALKDKATKESANSYCEMLILEIIQEGRRRQKWRGKSLEPSVKEGFGNVLKDYEEMFKIYLKALTQERNTKDKIYSLHEPQVACIAKGKSGKSYEFGTKVAVVRGRKTGIITSVKRFSGNPHDSKTLEESLAQSERVRKSVGGTRPKKASTDRGFRGIKEVQSTEILLPTKKEKTRYGQQVARLRFRARAAIEPSISHLKRNHSLGLNFLKGVSGDINNALLAGIGYNLKMRLNQIKEQILLWLELVFRIFLCKYNFQNEKLNF